MILAYYGCAVNHQRGVEDYIENGCEGGKDARCAEDMIIMISQYWRLNLSHTVTVTLQHCLSPASKMIQVMTLKYRPNLERTWTTCGVGYSGHRRRNGETNKVRKSIILKLKLLYRLIISSSEDDLTSVSRKSLLRRPVWEINAPYKQAPGHVWLSCSPGIGT
jgi:hypothetical protein